MIPPRLSGDALELLDQSHLDPAELGVSLRDVARLNRWFGGEQVVVNEVARVVRERGLTGRITMLDVGAGGADIPRAMVGWGKRQGFRFEVVACDRHAQVAAISAAWSAGEPAISLLRADALALPFPPACFDFVTCSLLIHHMQDEDQAVALLEKLRLLAQHAFIACDLERSRAAYCGVWFATHFLCRSRFTRHDGPVSVLRSYTLEELRALARHAGCPDMRWSRRPFYRAVGVWER